jgi:hypothetical protein
MYRYRRVGKLLEGYGNAEAFWPEECGFIFSFKGKV